MLFSLVKNARDNSLLLFSERIVSPIIKEDNSLFSEVVT